MGCAAAPAEVKIRKQRLPGAALRSCDDRRDCWCAPAFCCDCLGKWWLSSAPPSLQRMEEQSALAMLAAEHTSTCPTCRVPFCLSDCVPLAALADEPDDARADDDSEP